MNEHYSAVLTIVVSIPGSDRLLGIARTRNSVPALDRGLFEVHSGCAAIRLATADRQSSVYAPNGLDERLDSITNGSVVTTLATDLVGNLTTETDGLQNASQHHYDNLNRLSQTETHSRC